MKKIKLFSLGLFLLLSFYMFCQNDSTIIRELNSKIRFEFTTEPEKNSEKLFTITFTFFNDSNDSAWFLSSTCDGIVYSLEYDHDKFEVPPFMYCNKSIPSKVLIPPQEKISFTGL